jgi:4a-hydroxytetrahydrobiopterin dehydratase
MNLEIQECTVCHEAKPLLDQRSIELQMQKLDAGWIQSPQGHLEKMFQFKDFIHTMKFVNQIATVAEKLGHHPDLHISWGQCRVEIWTHFVQALTDRDFYLAVEIEKIFGEAPLALADLPGAKFR